LQSAIAMCLPRVVMVHLCGLVFFTLFLPGAARRSVRIGESHYDAQQQNHTFAKTFEVLSVARDTFLPGVSGEALFHRQGPGVNVQTRPGRYDLTPNRNLQIMATAVERNRTYNKKYKSDMKTQFGRKSASGTSRTAPKMSGPSFRSGRSKPAPPPPAPAPPPATG